MQANQQLTELMETSCYVGHVPPGLFMAALYRLGNLGVPRR